VNVYAWAKQLGYEESQIYGRVGIILKSDKVTLRYWLNQKVNIEGAPDINLVDEIGLSDKITTPIILDCDREYCIEGRHRLAAALKYNLDCPLIDLVLKSDDKEME
jgi:hypothetical protein